MTTKKANTNDIPKVNAKTTKDVMLAAYKVAVDRLKEARQNLLDIEGKKTDSATQAVITEAEKNLSADSIENLVHQVETFAGMLSGELDVYTNIKDAIAAKEKELQDLFGIEKTAETLAALVDSQAAIKETFEKESAEKVEELNQKLSDLEKKIQDETREYNETKKRKEEEDQYSFERMKKARLDELEDELAAKRKELEEAANQKIEELRKRSNDLNEREEAIKSQEQEIEDLKEKVAGMPEEIERAINAAVGKEKGMLQSKFDTEKKFMEATSASTTSVANAKVEELNKIVETHVNTITTLQGKLDEAYKEIKTMAVKTVEGIGSQKMIEDLLSKIGDGTTGKK